MVEMQASVVLGLTFVSHVRVFVSVNALVINSFRTGIRPRKKTFHVCVNILNWLNSWLVTSSKLAFIELFSVNLLFAK